MLLKDVSLGNIPIMLNFVKSHKDTRYEDKEFILERIGYVWYALCDFLFAR